MDCAGYFNKPIASLAGAGDKVLGGLVRLCGGERLRDLIFHLPTSVIDRTYSPTVADAEAGRIATLRLRVERHQSGRHPRAPHRVIATDGTGEIALVFFRPAPYLIKQMPVGAEIAASGMLAFFNGSLTMNHPDYIVPAAQFSEVAAHEPVYPLTYAITNRQVRKFAAEALAGMPEAPEWQEDAEVGFCEALRRLHADPYDNAARARLAYDELLARQLGLALERAEFKARSCGAAIGDGALRVALVASLGFSLTRAQERVLGEIFSDMSSGKRMLRLLQGDVGSGKTIVALLCLLAIVEAGAQGAMMAPTEILAAQHFETISALLARAGICAGVVLLTSRDKGKARREKLALIASGVAKIVVGTHALFQSDVEFANLALAIIDEQHKFGVAQRGMLAGKGREPANILAMTATPIPRTLAMTSYGDMDISVIDELPPGRKPIETRVMSMRKIPELMRNLHEKMLGEPSLKAYWICPLVNESDKLDLSAAMARYEDLREVFGSLAAIVHGQMKAEEKDAAASDFASAGGGARLLLATTVIEVGINVPAATVMIIEHAERFGLATLHQLRGRIGRGGESSVCLLLHSDRVSATARERLEIMRATTDGFKIAEEDLRLRGAGDVAGLKQSGQVDFRFADVEAAPLDVMRANEEARRIILDDPRLESPRGLALRQLLAIFGGRTLAE